MEVLKIVEKCGKYDYDYEKKRMCKENDGDWIFKPELIEKIKYAEEESFSKINKNIKNFVKGFQNFRKEFLKIENARNHINENVIIEAYKIFIKQKNEN